MKYWIDNKYYVEDNVDNAVIIQKCFDVAGPGHKIIVDQFIIRNSKNTILPDQGNPLNGYFFGTFKYESNHYIQLLKDRTATYNLYFLLLGISLTGLGIAYQVLTSLRNYLPLLLFIALLIYGVIHFLFLLRFNFLHFTMANVYYNMNIIREYYVINFQALIPNIDDFLPKYNRSYTFPSPFRPIISLIFSFPV